MATAHVGGAARNRARLESFAEILMIFCGHISPDGVLYLLSSNDNARVAQRWSTTLPRWGSRVRSPSRALGKGFGLPGRNGGLELFFR